MGDILKILSALILFCIINVCAAQSFVKQSEGVDLNDSTFPWELVIDRGKILGCIYENQYYSLGSILVLESLPRKCGQASDRNGIWEQLSESELVLFKQNIEIQQQLERESIYFGNAPISPQEARILRYIRGVKQFSDKNKQ